MINKIDKLYNELQAYIYHVLFEMNYSNKFVRIKKHSLETKEKAARIIKKELPLQFESHKREYTRKLKSLKFKKVDDLRGEDEIIIAAENRDIDNRLKYVHNSIMFFIERFLEQDKKVMALLEKTAVNRLQGQKAQNLVRSKIDFRQTELGQRTKQQARIGLNVTERVTRAGWLYRATFTRKEIEKKIKDVFLDMFGEIDFVAIRTKSGKIRKYTVKYYVHMVTRTESAYIKDRALIQTCNEWGCDLVQVSTHANPCAVCAPYEGEIYSLSGKHPVYPFIDLSWKHPNCMHTEDPYSEVLERAA